MDESINDDPGNALATFHREIVTMMVAADIPLKKLRHPQVRRIMTKYMKMTPPTESKSRDKILPFIHAAMALEIKERLVDKKIWISIDETKDRKGRFVGAVIIRVMNDVDQDPFMVRILEFKKPTGKAVARAVDGVLIELGIKRENVHVFLSDGAAYMKVAGK